MAYTPINVSSGTVSASSDFALLQANFDAIASANSGAPQIQKAAISSGFGFDHMAWGESSTSGTLTGSSGALSVTMNAYSMLPAIYTPDQRGGADPYKAQWYVSAHPTQVTSGSGRFSLRQHPDHPVLVAGSYHVAYRYLP